MITHILATMRLLSVLHAPIQDCDEVFNYLEPLNFLTRGFGKQTWEYSPVYAIRSYAYLLPLTIVLKPFTFLADQLQLFPAWWCFYLIRAIIAAFTVYSELQLYNALKSTLLNKKIANWYLVLTLVNTGYSHASVALLPSNLAMNCTTLSVCYLIKFTASKKTRHSLLSIKWLIIGSLWGWPFIAVLSVPLLFYILLIASKIMLNRFILWSLVALFFNLVVIMQIDYSFYHKTMVVPLNIVLYNVFNTSEIRGPEIFGTEPVQYYIYNLLLNFNLIAPLAYLGLVFIPIMGKCQKINDTGLKVRELFIITSGLLLWSLIFFKQPHKEERFLYPIYSIINVSSAIMIQYLINFMGVLLSFIKVNDKIIKLSQKFVIYATLLIISILSVTKTVNLSKNYNNFTEVYKYIPQLEEQLNVCTGREWYHYPSSFFLPLNHRLKFIKSSFNGLLPGDFLESESIFNGVRNIPEGMNDLNQFDPSKITTLEYCDYVVDVDEVVDYDEVDFWKEATYGEDGHWELIKELDVIDTSKSSGLAKLIWLPQFVKDMKLGFIGEAVYEKVGLFRRKRN